MPLVTYVNDNERDKIISELDNTVLSELLTDIREMTGEDWLVRRMVFTEKKGWFKKEEVTLYQILAPAGPEYQVINLIEGSGYNTATSVANFLIGYRCALGEMLKNALTIG